MRVRDKKVFSLDVVEGNGLDSFLNPLDKVSLGCFKQCILDLTLLLYLIL